MAVLKPRAKRTAFSGQRQPPSKKSDAAQPPAKLDTEDEQQADSVADVASAATLYERLNSEHTVRLLTLYAASDNATLVTCTLTVHDFDKAIPKYTALSYVWGSTYHKKRISVNGHELQITANLHEALTHVRSHDIDQVFWIDAICINQQDLDERSHQVPLMRDIYAEAQQVISYLGPATEALESDSPKDIVRDIASRPYWTRVWIIQEFVLGKDNILQCGHMRFHYKDFAQGLSPKSEFTKQMAELMGLKKMWSSSNDGLPFTIALRFSATAKATDARDIVFGILGLVRSEEVRSL